MSLKSIIILLILGTVYVHGSHLELTEKIVKTNDSETHKVLQLVEVSDSNVEKAILNDLTTSKPEVKQETSNRDSPDEENDPQTANHNTNSKGPISLRKRPVLEPNPRCENGKERTQTGKCKEVVKRE